MRGFLQRIEKLTEDGRAYRKELCADILRLSAVAGLPLSGQQLKKITDGLNVAELKEFREKLRQSDGMGEQQIGGLDVQLTQKSDGQFKI